MDLELKRKLMIYQITTVLGVMFALIGFSYNVWRMEVSETNDTIRVASFEMLTELAELEQLIYIAIYDGDTKEGSPRKAWVKVGLIRDLSVLTGKSFEKESQALKNIWASHWSTMIEEKNPQMLSLPPSIQSAMK